MGKALDAGANKVRTFQHENDIRGGGQRAPGADRGVGRAGASIIYLAVRQPPRTRRMAIRVVS